MLQRLAGAEAANFFNGHFALSELALARGGLFCPKLRGIGVAEIRIEYATLRPDCAQELDDRAAGIARADDADALAGDLRQARAGGFVGAPVLAVFERAIEFVEWPQQQH